MDRRLRSKTSTIDIYIKLAQYPTLQDDIRAKMRQEVFNRGIVTEDEFEREVKEKAIESQHREGVHDPFKAEPFRVWQLRNDRIRAFHTDYYFAYNLPRELFDQIIDSVVRNEEENDEYRLTFNPEIAPWSMLFAQGERYEKMPPNKRKEVLHHLEEIKVVLIRGMITDQLPLIAVAKRVLSIADLRLIYQRRIGEGKIGGKAAGMIIAWRILHRSDDTIGPDLSSQVEIPESYFLGTDVMYQFRRHAGLDDRMNQKYKPLETIAEQYPRVIEDHVAGDLPPDIVLQLRDMLKNLGDRPVIVRSSSLLEDNFGSAFAGKYDSVFCPNQGTMEENLAAVMAAIKRVYASTLNPDAILYRKRNNLLDFDERMAVLIQEVRGERFGDNFMPALAGVGFSQNPFRWNPKIRREEGFLRLVWGLGTRAVDRVSADYPRLISLSHPTLRPETKAAQVIRYSQHNIDVIDLKTNEFTTKSIHDVLTPRYPYVRFIASIVEDQQVKQPISFVTQDDDELDFVLTFDPLTKDRQFVKLMRTALMRLEKRYGTAVDVEFAVQIIPKYPHPEYKLWLLQCRPLSQRAEGEKVKVPKGVSAENILFSENRFVPNGQVEDIRYVVFVDPEKYREIANQTDKREIGRAVGRINRTLADENFVLMGPGRWGSANLDLGVSVGYADIFNTKVLIEIAEELEGGGRPDLSYGTHFFQDLVEAGIYSLPLHLDNPKSTLNKRLLRESENVLGEISAEDVSLAPYLIIIDLARQPGNLRLNIYMDGENDEALGLLTKATEAGATRSHQGTLSTF